MGRFSRFTSVLLLACAGFAGACSRRATLHLRDGRSLRGTIEGNAGEHVRVDLPKRGTIAIPKSEIREVDHPGTALIVTGVSLIAAGALSGYAIAHRGCEDELGYDTCRDERREAPGEGWLTFAAFALPGLALGGCGIVIKLDSISRFEAHSSVPWAQPRVGAVVLDGQL